MARPGKDDASEDAKKIVDEAKNFIEKAISDIGKTSATKQLILGTTSGWITGFISMKIGKVAAVGLGGSVILLHIASQKGYIDINWDKINKKVDKISDKIEKEATGKSPDWFEKERYGNPISLICFNHLTERDAAIHKSERLNSPVPNSNNCLGPVERFVDRKLDKAEDLLKKKEVKAKRWVDKVAGGEHYRATESHVFLASFVAGMAIGLLCGK